MISKRKEYLKEVYKRKADAKDPSVFCKCGQLMNPDINLIDDVNGTYQLRLECDCGNFKYIK